MYILAYALSLCLCTLPCSVCCDMHRDFRCNINQSSIFFWSLTLREFEKRVLRRIFGPKRDEVTAEWRKIHNEELNDL